MTDLTFSPERAARGEPVQYLSGFFTTTNMLKDAEPTIVPEWDDCHFVGLDVDGRSVVQVRGSGTSPKLWTLKPVELRMKPMPAKKWVLEFPSEAAANWAQNNLFINGRFGNVGYAIPPIKEVVIQPEDA